MDISKIGENIDKIRKSRGWSKAELARRTGLSQMMVGNHMFDNGKCMRLETAVKYAEVLGCTLDDLTGDVIDPLKFDCKADITRIYPYNLAVALACNVHTATDKERLDAAYSVYIPGLLKALEHLTEKEQKVICLRYVHDFTLDNVATEFNLTKSRISYIEQAALRKLRALRNYWNVECIKKEVAAQARRQIGNYNAFDDMPISNLRLSVRAYNCLRRSGIDTLGKLSEMTYDDLMKVRNLGRKSLEEILTAARDYGITFKWEGETNDQN